MQLHAGRQRRRGGTAQSRDARGPMVRPVVVHLTRQLHDRDRAAHRRPAAQARVQPRRPREPHGRPYQCGVPAAGRRHDDGLLLRRGLVAELEVLEPVADGLGEVTRGDVLRRVLRRYHLKALGGAYLTEVRHLQQALVECRQQQVLRRLRQAVQLVEKEDVAAAHGADQRPRDERFVPIAEPKHERGVEPAREAALRAAVVAVHAHRLATQVAAHGKGDGRLARAHGPLEQQVTPAREGGEGRLELTLAAHDAVPPLHLPHRVHHPMLPHRDG